MKAVLLLLSLALFSGCKKTASSPTENAPPPAQAPSPSGEAKPAGDTAGGDSSAHISDNELRSLFGSSMGKPPTAATGASGAAGPAATAGGDTPPPIVPYQCAHSDQDKCTQPQGTYESTVINQPGKDFAFICPGDAMISGLQSSYDETTHDRLWQVNCQFFSDQQGATVRKISCNDIADPSPVQKDRKFSCPEGKLLAGISSTFIAAKNDRLLSYQCCSFATADNKAVVLRQDHCTNRVPKTLEITLSDYWKKVGYGDGLGILSINDEVNDWKESAIISCSLPVRYDTTKSGDNAITRIDGTIIASLGSTWSGTYLDRRFSHQCCQLELGN